MDIARLIRRSLVLVLAGALLLGGFSVYFLMRAQAMREATHESRLLLSTATAIRDYTTASIRPILETGDDSVFHRETVPSYAAHTVFEQVRAADQAYAYREAALNPTNPDDLPIPFETALINTFRADETVLERSGAVKLDGLDVFYLARPIRIENPACLACHSTPERAPAAMVAQYGPNNGFGWELNEVVGVQVVTVPIAHQMRGAYETVLLVCVGLLVIFSFTYALISGAIHRQIVQPLQTLAARAEDTSVGADGGDALPEDGAEELRALSRAINRLRTSLDKALARLRGEG
jgi:protein-histidine pros-kinase